jgi:hypothetical protein
MTFADLVAGDVIFLDANTLVYHFTSDLVFGAACSQLLQAGTSAAHRAHDEDLRYSCSRIQLAS